jgi:hypothetical protein
MLFTSPKIHAYAQALRLLGVFLWILSFRVKHRRKVSKGREKYNTATVKLILQEASVAKINNVTGFQELYDKLRQKTTILGRGGKLFFQRYSCPTYSDFWFHVFFCFR